VGDMVLQQLAQARQSVSCHTVALACTTLVSNPRGGFFSILVRKRLKADLFVRMIPLYERSVLSI
jgi:hypothetical protein